jgi:uncharacterized heparinase superfamily protein
MWHRRQEFTIGCYTLHKVMKKVYTRAILHRFIKPALWRWFGNARASKLSDNTFCRSFPFSKDREGFLREFHNAARLKFFFHPRNQKDFFLHLITQTQPYEEILSDAQDVIAHQVDMLGSGKILLGETINWRKDFTTGMEWPLRRLTASEIIDADQPSDIKVVWELNRFHLVWWLGKAYWVTNNEEYARSFRALIDDWIDKNPLGRGPNWFGAMEVAIRACNWIAGYYFFCESRSLSGDFWIRFLKSLYVHGLFIEDHLEYSRRNGNHLLSDIVGLLVLGTFFQSAPFGQRWLSWSANALQEEMETQVYSDGVDYEKSIGYHRYVLELFYTATILCRKNNIPLSEEFLKRLEKMFDFTLAYTRSDGSAPNVGDAADGRLFRFSPRENFNDHRHALSVGSILFERADLRTAAGSFGQDSLWLFGAEGFERHQMLHAPPSPAASTAFAEGGFYIMQSESAHVFIDAGDIGMQGRGGHGHNDTFSFELWCDGGPLIVDSGTFTYTADVRTRNEFRSTRLHNTLMVDQTELAEFASVWSIQADETHPRVREWRSVANNDVLEAVHFAYLALPSRITHARRFELTRGPFSLVVTDKLEGSGTHLVENFLHLSPDVTVEIIGPQKAIARKGNRQYIVTVSTGDLSLAETWYSRSYGQKERKKTLMITRHVFLPAELVIRIDRESSA